jgi:hypothetical protein
MQDLTLASGEVGARAEGRLDYEFLVPLRDCGKGEDLPLFLLEYMTDQIVLVEALHDQDDAASFGQYASDRGREPVAVMPVSNSCSACF